MSGEDLRSRAHALRAAGSAPKQIARELGIPRSKVVSLLHSGSAAPIAPTRSSNDVARLEQRLVGCWISRQWSNGLSIADRPADWIDDEKLPPLAMGAGLVSIVVVRERAGTELGVCGYLVDTYCLGVKNAVPPSMIQRRDLTPFIADYFGAYDKEPLTAPLSLAQHLVFGAVDYARTLGFDPHPDFYLARPHLGEWQPPCRIGFGRDGVPFFQQGPRDNAARIMRTLDRSVGAGNYHFTTVMADL